MIKKIGSLLIFLSLPAQAQVTTHRQDSQNINNTEFHGVRQKNVVGARVHVPLTTSDCMGSSGLGGQGQFFGFSFSSTTQSKPCNIREDTKIAMYVLENEELARKIFMQGDYAKQTIQSTDVCKYPTDECKQSKRFK